ncbi:type I polyketide synthase [Apibacter adventoris]|uniref:Erythronolide synthase n=1 Tax=Apibacter adventoris TaxID=1679466 RepID=A0A2S8A732_9FLAO|nr:type I polyketide synthase [Apibacter adventoris]PQL90385.1 erythronolide synthase [Apibacter adventoris]
MQEKKELFVLSPFEIPDVNLALNTFKSGAFPILHLGHNKKLAEQCLKDLSEKTKNHFGVCYSSQAISSIELPKNVSKVILPLNIKFSPKKNIELYYQVYSLEEAITAIKNGAKNIILKGNEGAGKVAYESTFVLFQGIMKNYSQLPINIYLQGGMGIHTSAAALALGAKGIILDSQVALFPECSTLNKETKNILSKLSGSETILIDNFRVLLRKNSPSLPKNPTYNDIIPFLGGADLSQNILPMGQDITLSVNFVDQYKNLSHFIFAIHEASYGHLLQAQSLNILSSENNLCKDLNIKFPIAQGPMARVSDVPEFAKKISQEGALPFIAMSLMQGNTAKNTVLKTAKLLKDQTWGVGILGFAPVQLRDEQMKYILEAKPPIVLIAGGRPSLAKPYEKEGIKVFLHVPSSSLLDMFLKEGARNFIFEGRESGGHVGPLSCLVLWEKQILRLLKQEDIPSLNLFFAGGIHNDFSSAFISIMTATLAARGAKIGVLMGSSYLYTKEAVDTGAIVSEYQTQAINQDKTVLLEAAPGQETRALDSPFIDYFNQKKQQLLSQGLDSKEVWIKLEELNIGRLRIASKGIERKGDKLIYLNNKEQVEKGIYMIGQIAALQDKAISIKELHTRVAINSQALILKLDKIQEPTPPHEPVKLAIVGMAGIFPGAQNLDEYWKNIILGKDSITEVPDSRWNKDLFYNPETRDTDYVSSKWGGFIPTIDFDPLEFGIPPQSLASIEPVQLLSLLVAKRALEDAGYDLATFDGENTSVIIGAEGATDLAAAYGFRGYAKQVFGELPEEFKQMLPKLNEDSFPGVLSNVVAGRIANRLNLGGSNFTVDAACASSLAALDIAYQELQNNKSDIVILGGADLHNGLNDFLMFSATYALSKKGYCASFDSESDGIALGEGIGMIILKRLEDAERDNDRIYAVIRGTGGSSDGRNLGMTAPNKKGQIKALQRAYKNAGILPSEVELIEAHGTGTVVGDRTELSALTDMFLESGAVKGQTHLGSVKTQIGHTKCAAGIAGVIKAALSTYYGIQPPTLHLNKPNPFYNKEISPFVFNKKAGIWNNDKRISGISAFGFGGTNFHVVMENYQPTISTQSTLPSWPSELFVFRGDTLEEAQSLLQKIKQLLHFNDKLPLKNIAYSLSLYNKKDIQICIVATNHEDLLSKIDVILSNQKNEKGIYLRNLKKGKIVFLFSGQGSQRVNMARDLFVAFPAMRELLQQNKEYEKVIFPHAVFDDESLLKQKKSITETQNTQPLLGIVDLAIAKFLHSLGIKPDILAGHSYGELPALCFSGVFAPEHLVFLSRERANAILEAVKDDKGKMIAVSIDERSLKELLQGEKEIWPVNFNSQKQIILAGTTTAMNSFVEKLNKKNISSKELAVDCAFHSPLLKEAKNIYAKYLKKISFSKPTIPVWSNTTADAYPSEVIKIKERLSEHLIQPVLFSKEIKALYDHGARIFIETGPGRVLINLAQTILGKDEITTIQTEDKNEEGIEFILKALAQYISTGNSIQVEKLFDGRNVHILDIDNPEQYKKNSTLWLINGHNAIPSVGKLPSNGALPITKPVKINGMSGNSIDNISSLSNSEQVILEYLNNMKSIIQNQRDVMLGYLGQPPSIEVPIQTANTESLPQSVSIQSSMNVDTIVTSANSNFSVEEIKKLLLETVSEKTGYPIDMLGLDLDLEADLSIDSIKRMEIIGALREKLGITDDLEESEDAIERMASIKTLNGLIEWIEELAKENKKNINNQSSLEISQKLDNTITTNLVTSTDKPFSIPSAQEIKALLLETVSEKTGYPIDMLGLDLDLEADLSIDSIKRMEIIGALREKLGFTDDLEESEDAIERMASIKTLNGMIKWIEELTNPENLSLINHAQQHINHSISFDNKSISELESTLINKNNTETTLLRAKLSLEKWNDPDAKILDINNKKLAIVDDGGSFSKNVKNKLESKGAKVDIINGNEDLSDYNGLILLDTIKSSIHYKIDDVFQMVKQLNLENVEWIFIFSDTLVELKKEKDIKKLNQIEGFPGFIKSIAREYSHINCRCINSYSPFNTKSISEIVHNELSISDISSEIIYKEKERFRYNIISEPLSKTKDSKLQLDINSVVLVLGGAQGITSELIIHLSKEYPCHYILVGRSPIPKPENKKYVHFSSKNEIREFLISEEKMKIPAEIEKKVNNIYKENQIIKTLTKIKESGSKVTYKSVDITNEKNFRKLIQNIYKKDGKIDGVIHAAGLLIDKLFAHKTLDSFKQVYSTKITPLHILFEELKPDVKFITFFSSIASVYGNRGQCDYAAANSVFDLIAQIYTHKNNSRILTINWGPWKGAGMVSSALESEFNKRGISLIPLKEGAKSFIDELKYGTEKQIMIMGEGDGVKQFFGI